MRSRRSPTVRCSAASKKQTPFSVWYSAEYGEGEIGTLSLKEADAFQRLVYGRAACRSSGLDASKKQTPFSVWYAPCAVDVAEVTR